MEEFLHFRIHTDELEIPALLEFLHTQSNVDFVVREFGKSNREHIHSCIKLNCNRNTFVSRLKTKFPVIKGNAYYGLGKLRKDYDTNARYCYKGTANDYPDILYTIHSEEEWKTYYTKYWEQFKSIAETKVNMECQNAPFVAVVKKKKAPTFMEKLIKRIEEEYEPLVQNLWKHYGYKNSEGCLDKTTLSEIQDILAEQLLLSLGKARKNIDDMIFERMYRGLYYGLISDCPTPLLRRKGVEMLNPFRAKLN